MQDNLLYPVFYFSVIVIIRQVGHCIGLNPYLERILFLLRCFESVQIYARMLSILIPIYNFDIRTLAAELHRQCKMTGVEFEILCLDDGSNVQFKEKNRELRQFSEIQYIELPQNLGRSAIRNELGRQARFSSLLFMDCDSKVVSHRFIQHYLDTITPDSLVYGGRCYAAQPPADPSLYFHWHYGRSREQTTAAQRNQAPWHSFMTNNFLIPKHLFLQVPFDETIRQYGHEDTIFGLELDGRNTAILHIDNPLEHIGLETTDVFLQKTRQGLENLLLLRRQGKPIQTRLLEVYLKCKAWGLGLPLRYSFRLLERWLIRHFHSARPNLKLFDFYKLGLLAILDEQQKTT